MDFFDASDFDFLLSKSTGKRIVLALVVGIAFVPPVRSWYIGQIERHAEHITQEIQDHLTPDVVGPHAEPTPGQTARP